MPAHDLRGAARVVRVNMHAVLSAEDSNQLLPEFLAERLGRAVLCWAQKTAEHTQNVCRMEWSRVIECSRTQPFPFFWSCDSRLGPAPETRSSNTNAGRCREPEITLNFGLGSWGATAPFDKARLTRLTRVTPYLQEPTH